LSGGKFANGAITAAFVYLFNNAMKDHQAPVGSPKLKLATEMPSGLTQDQINKMSPSDVVLYWLSGGGGNLNFTSDSEMSKIFSQDMSAKNFEDFIYQKFNGNPQYLDGVTHYGYTFTWARAAVTFNSAEQVIGSWDTGTAVVLSDRIVFQVHNTMGANSLFFGRQLGEHGFTPFGHSSGDLNMTIEWATPLRSSH
jgi:hypothetical protein